MSNEIEKDFDEIIEEMSSKIKQATELLREAGQLASKVGVTTDYYGDMSDLNQVIQDLAPAKQAWDNSSWCAYGGEDGWNESGCSQ